MGDSQLLFFVITSVVIILIPGQDMVLVMSRGLTQGSRAGVITAAGVSTGLLGHTLLAGLGLGAVLTASELLFSMLKYIGAAYLVYLGVRLIIHHQGGMKLEAYRQDTNNRLFYIGAISNLSNPKITVFYFAFLPQFVPLDISHPTVALLALGALFSLLTFLIKAPIGYFSGTASNWIRTRPSIVALINRISGIVLIGLGLRLAAQQQLAD